MAVVPRRELLLTEGAKLFAARGFHGVSIEELGAAAGVSGPAVYRHFSSKDSVLAEMLVGISRHLLDGGRAVTRDATGAAALRALVAFHLDFTLGPSQDLIRVQDRDLANLSAGEARRVRSLQRSYVGVWVEALQAHRPALSAAEARLRVQAVIGMLNSTPHSAGRDPALARRVLGELAGAALDV